MLARPHRLTSSKEIRSCVTRGRRLLTPYFTLYWREKASDTPTRAACVAGKKISPSSVIRHRAKRQLREVAREIITFLPRRYDIVLVARPALAGQPPVKQLTSQANALVRKISPPPL